MSDLAARPPGAVVGTATAHESALLHATGRAMYLKHIGDFGADGGVAVMDLRGAGTTALGQG